MILLSELFNPNKEVLVELRIMQGIKNLFNSRDRRMEAALKKPKVKEFVKLSQRVVRDERLSSSDSIKFQKLMKDNDVETYLETVDEVAIKSGVISGSVLGSIGGGLSGAGIAAGVGLSGFGIIAALGVLGAVAGGIALGKATGRMVEIFSKWGTREKLSKQAGGITRASEREKPVAISMQPQFSQYNR